MEIRFVWVLAFLVCGIALAGCVGEHNESDRFTAISSGHEHTCVLRGDGTAVCWGGDWLGQSSPPPDEKFIAISSGAAHTCALGEDGSPVCWGLKDPKSPSGATPPPDEKFVAISSGNSHTCGLRMDGSPVCWGANWGGQTSPPSNEKFIAITSSFDYSCGIREDTVALCWGKVEDQPALYIREGLTSISGGYSDACGLKADGTVICWDKYNGENYYPLSGQKLSYLGSHVSNSYYQYRCGIGFNGSAVCWSSFRLGRDIKTYQIPSEKKFVEIGTGLSHICGILKDGSVACWGANRVGQSMPPTFITPTPVPPISDEMCEPGLIVLKGSGGCLVEESSLLGTYRFVVTPSGRGDMYDIDGKLSESQYGWVDFSYIRINGAEETRVVLRAHANRDGSWTIDAASHWE